MSQSRYDAYKDSGVAWLGQVPAHWEVRKLATIARLGSGTTPKTDQVEYYENGTIPWVNTGDLNDGMVSSPSKYITSYALNDISTLKLYASDSVIIAMYGATIGKLGICEFQTTVNQACSVIIPHNVLTNKYVFYTLLKMRQYLLSLAVGGTQPNISQDVISTLRLPLPPLAEQQAIAAFLDRECARIDALVAAQQRMIALSKEKRQALISQAVTRGLDPAAPCKDSGVAWLGQVPAHWEVKRLNILGQFLKGSGGTKEDITSEGLPCIRYGELYGKYDKFIEKIFNFISPKNENAYTRIYFQDVIFAASGEKIDEIGKSAVYLSFDLAVCGGDTVIFRPFENIFFGRFLGYTCDSVHSQQQKSSMYRGTTIKHIYPDELKNIIIPLPPLAEQQAIAAFLDRECTRIDALIERAEQAIVLLRERRSALIAAAVTGQIRVGNEE